MNWWRKFFTKRAEAELRRRRVRVEHLLSVGRVIDLRDVAPESDVLRLGVEYWVVKPGFVLLPRISEVDGGMLILDDGLPLADKSKLKFLQKRVQPVVFTIKP